MNWSDLEHDIGAAAPLLGTLIGGPVGPVLGAAVASALGVQNTPDAVQQAIKTDPDAAVKLRQIEADENLGVKTLANKLAMAQMDAQQKQLDAVNQTMQAELSHRTFSWRDYWGFVSGTAFAVVVACVAYIVGMAVYMNQYAGMEHIPAIVGSFSVLFGIAATILGVQSSIETHHAGMASRIAAAATGGNGSGTDQ